MLKRILNSQYFSLSLDAIGIFSLASFLVLGLFLRFIVDILPPCYFTGELFEYVECGKGFLGKLLNFYFSNFSSLVNWVFLVFALVESVISFNVAAFFLTLLLCFIIALSVLTSFRMAYMISKKLIWKRTAYNQQEKSFAFLLLLIVLSPTISTGLLKYYIKPPQSSGRIITIDMWHNELSIPRRYLQDWSLVGITRPAEERGLRGKNFRKKSPFANLYMSAKEIDSSLPEGEKVSIRIAPHYNVMSNEDLFQTRENYLQTRISENEYKIERPLYETSEIVKEWEIYKSATASSGYKPDIYIHRRTDGKIENILECTRICNESSFGTSEYLIQYSLDKKDLNNYFDLHQKILNFIETHSTAKAAPDLSK